MKISELTTIFDNDKHLKVKLESNEYTAVELNKYTSELYRTSHSYKWSAEEKFSYRVVILDWEIAVRLTFYLGAPEIHIDLNNLKRNSEGDRIISSGSYDFWTTIPNDVLYHLISIKNLIKDFKEDKIPWPFSEEELAKRTS